MIKKLTLSGMLTALAVALAYLEHLFPIQALIPVPGVKMGLANTIILFAFIYLNARAALLILIIRCMIQSLLFGTLTGFLFSMSGGLLAFSITALLLPHYKTRFSAFGLCIAGAAMHHIGQIVAACLLFLSSSLIFYLPALLMLSLLTGMLTGYVCSFLFPRLERVIDLQNTKYG